MPDNVDAAWLRPIRPDRVGKFFKQCLGNIVNGGSSTAMETSLGELTAAAVSATGVEAVISGEPVGDSCIAIGTSKTLNSFIINNINEIERQNIAPEGYIIKTVAENGMHAVIVMGGSEHGVLYGVYHLLRLIGSGAPAPAFVSENPRNPLRMLNQWDNADGTIERGYAGLSFFYRKGRVVDNLTRVRQYARLLASVGINGIAVNNVNVHDAETEFIRGEGLRGMARLASVFRAYGIRLFISVNFASPIWLDNMRTADPLDEGVRNWWREAAATIYRAIPDLGGFLVKADSEHRPGPFEYGRNHADGANMLAEALEPFGGIVLWRCFVYNCMQDWRDRATDRAKAAYEHFMPLDGQFRDNVILQIKNGPMDFQVREPVSPLFGAMTRTNQMLELQVTQEYTGQQRHLCYLAPQWKDVLDFDTHWRGEGSEVKRIVAGELHPMRSSGMAAVSNVGSDVWWTGHPLAQANLYAFGRLSWNPDLTAEAIADEWIRLTFGNDERVIGVLLRMMMSSWRIYESYTAPLGVGWMVSPGHHYGPDVDGYEFSHWGTYHFADSDGVGVDRTIRTGTGFTSQYHPANGDVYGSLEDCPDELLLFFHHVPYTHKLQNGKTVIQYIYDTHFAGAVDADQLLQQWRSLQGAVDNDVYERVEERLEEQAAHAMKWRDAINSYFYTKSGIADEHGRVMERLPFDVLKGSRKLVSIATFAVRKRWKGGARLVVARRRFTVLLRKFKSAKGE